MLGLNEVSHHLGNGAQILQFIKKDNNNLNEAYSHLLKALELVRSHNGSESEESSDRELEKC